MTIRRASWLAALLLFAIYAATLAPGVTFWDAGEFIAAARVLGIPHPPGTPLFIVLLNAWARLLWFLPFATATNLLSASCTAAAAGLTAAWVGRATDSAWLAIASGIAAGAMTTAWQNATETEVYAASLLLSVMAIVAGDLAGRASDRRWLVLAAYLLALAIPLHLSALVAAPVVIYLVSERADGRRDLAAGGMLAGIALCVAACSRLSAPIGLAGLALLLASVGFGVRGTPRLGWRTGLLALATCVIALSAVVILVLRARHDPPINQANPASWRQLAYVIGRRQYDVAGMFPRQAAWWLQIANWFEYADWQFALSLGPTVVPTIPRVAVTFAFAALAILGSTYHRRRDPRTWRAVLLLLVCGSVGVGMYLNLKAGASFAWTIVEDPARHEARDRDYFFVLAFWAWGIWAGIGAIALVQRLRSRAAVGLALACLPVALNWGAVTRRSEPEASLPRAVALALLQPLPPTAVLFVAGDNDTYPLWYAQQVEGVRTDVTVVTMPLLGAPWYPDEVERREHLLPGATASGDVLATSANIADGARARGRPVVVAATVPAPERDRLGVHWTNIGLAYVAAAARPEANAPMVEFDRAAITRSESLVRRLLPARALRPSLDGVHEYFLGVLGCPHVALEEPSAARLATLDSLCNLRAPNATRAGERR